MQQRRIAPRHHHGLDIGALVQHFDARRHERAIGHNLCHRPSPGYPRASRRALGPHPIGAVIASRLWYGSGARFGPDLQPRWRTVERVR